MLNTCDLIIRAFYYSRIFKWSYEVGRYTRSGTWDPIIISPGMYEDPAEARLHAEREIRSLRAAVIRQARREGYGEETIFRLSGGAA